jgi:hypothetical protein
MADRNVFSLDQAKPQDKELPGDLEERCDGAGMGCDDILSSFCMANSGVSQENRGGFVRKNTHPEFAIGKFHKDPQTQ